MTKQNRRTSKRIKRAPAPVETVVATPFKRVQAFLIDMLFFAIYVVILTVLTLFVPRISGWMAARFDITQPILSDFSAFMLVILPFLLYFAILEASRRRGSWGKQRMGLLVMGPTGGRLSFGRSLLRSVVKFLPWQIGHTAVFQAISTEWMLDPVQYLLFGVAYGLPLVYLIVLWRHPQHRAPHDLLSGATVVVRK